MAGERLVQLMLEAGKDANPSSELADLIYGKVISISPLKVQIVNEPKMVLSEAFLILSPFCKEKTFTIPKWNTNNETEHTHAIRDTYSGGGSSSPTSHKHSIPKHEVQVWRGLKVGDKVLMLRIHQGNMFYVLQREGDL